MTNFDAENAAVAKLAYEYWEAEGRPDGRDVEHWLRAERTLDGAAKPQRRTKKPTRAPARERSSKRRADRR